ncbi:MAG: mechanosensitive ion channel family protein [Bacilli bacterium]|nr:mechanosensitive ion channel family protein [Bacilli bacterium]
MEIFDKKIPSEVIQSVIIVLLAFIIYFIIKAIIKKIVNIKSEKKRGRRKTVLVLFKNISKYVIILITIICLLAIWHVNTMALVTSIGALSVVIGLVFQDLLKDILVGISIIMEDTFSLGDYVEINGFKGEVVNFNFKSTRLKSLTNEVRIISNRNITEVTNFSLNKIMLLINVNAPYEEEYDKVEKVLTEVVKNLSKDEIFDEIVLAPGIEELASSSVVYRITGLISIKDKFTAKRKILKEIKVTFDKNKINIPYTQIEVHNAK